MDKLLPALLGGGMMLLYLFMAWCFTRSSARTLLEYFRRERLPYEIVPGTIVDFEMRWVGRPRSSGKQIVFYPVFEYQWNGETHRKFHRRVTAALGPGLTPVPATRLKVGDAVDVRVFHDEPGNARIEEPLYFWKSRIWGHMITVIAGCAMMLFGIHSALRMLFA